jgi:hypothetical protein
VEYRIQECPLGLPVRTLFTKRFPAGGIKGPTAILEKEISAITSSKEVFDMSKWHKTAGSYRSPPIKNL